MVLPILDKPNENIAKYFKQAVVFMQELLAESASNRVLIHW